MTTSLRGRRAIWLTRAGALIVAAEPVMFGLTLAAGVYLATHQAGALVVLDRRGAARSEHVLPGLLLLLGVTLIAAALLFFHRKGRLLRQRLLASAAAFTFFAVGLARELHSARAATFFGLTTLRPGETFTPTYPPGASTEYTTNRWGLRGPDFAPEKPPSTTRIAVIGDAFVFGAGISDPDTLPVQLASALKSRAPTHPIEPLNLGVPGDNLHAHLQMVDIAERHLTPDAIVLCLTLPDDLSEWDAQSERRDHARLSGFSFMSFFFGYPAALTLWSERNLASDLAPERLTFLTREVTAFNASRPPEHPPLFVFTFTFNDARVAAALRTVPGAILVPPLPHDPAHYLPGHGHPTPAANTLFAARLADHLAPHLFPDSISPD
ncbi:MAG: hypothetical protein R3B70_16040 [Polyangiaceae bacterium]